MFFRLSIWCLGRALGSASASSWSTLTNLIFIRFWLVGCFGLNEPLRVFQSISDGLPKKGRRKREMTDERKNVQTTPPAPTASVVGPCPTWIQVSRTPRHWKFTQHHHTTRPSPIFMRSMATSPRVSAISAMDNNLGEFMFASWRTSPFKKKSTQNENNIYARVSGIFLAGFLSLKVK